MPVNKLIPPGPEHATATPNPSFAIFAYAFAANAAACSCLVSTNVINSDMDIEWITCDMELP